MHLDLFNHEYSIRKQPYQHNGQGEIQEHSAVMIDGNLVFFGGSTNQSLLERFAANDLAIIQVTPWLKFSNIKTGLVNLVERAKEQRDSDASDDTYYVFEEKADKELEEDSNYNQEVYEAEMPFFREKC